MTQQLQQGVLEVRLVWETPPGNADNSKNHMMNVLTDALATRVKNVAMALAMYDVETGIRLRKVELGECSPEMRVLIESELGTDDDPNEPEAHSA